MALATDLDLLKIVSSQSRRLENTLFLVEDSDAIQALASLISANLPFEIYIRRYKTLSLISTYPPYQPEEG